MSESNIDNQSSILPESRIEPFFLDMTTETLPPVEIETEHMLEKVEQITLPEWANLELGFAIKDEELAMFKENAKHKFKGKGKLSEKIVTVVDVVGVLCTPSPYQQSVSHWGIIVDDTLYHLVFVVDKKKQPQSVHFTFQKTVGMKIVNQRLLGKTKFSHDDLNAIGDLLVSNFGTYHRIFWNCQHFVNCFLDIICDGEFEPIQTSAAVLRMAMFASTTGAPTAIIKGLQEQPKSNQLIEQTKSELEMKSDNVIVSILPEKSKDDGVKDISYCQII